jgi:hypothetical protein
MALYLDLPQTDGKLAATVKEKSLSIMFDSHVGFMHAVEQIGCGKPMAMHDYKVDANFAENVDLAERMLVMYESEKILQIADGAKGREDAAAVSLKVKTRERMRDALLPKWRDAQRPAHLEQHVHQHRDTFVTLSPENQKQLREQRKRILATTRGASALAPTTASESQEQPVSARIQPSGLLEREPVREAEVIEEEQPEPAPQEPHREPEWVTNWKRAADTKTSQDHGEEVSDDGLSPLQ